MPFECRLIEDRNLAILTTSGIARIDDFLNATQPLMDRNPPPDVLADFSGLDKPPDRVFFQQGLKSYNSNKGAQYGRWAVVPQSPNGLILLGIFMLRRISARLDIQGFHTRDEALEWLGLKPSDIQAEDHAGTADNSGS